MRRTAAIISGVFALVGATGAAGASGPVFTVVPATPSALPSAEIPNPAGSIVLPTAFTSPPATTATMPFAQLNALWRRAGAAYGIPWQVLASINKIESNFGRNMGPSSAGAVGWMQFMPSTWLRWGMDASGDGIADPWNPEDAVFAAARYLAAAGGRSDLERAVFAYNHADWYVRDVLDLAAVYGDGDPVLTFTLDRLQVELDGAREEVARANAHVVAAARNARRSRALARDLTARAATARLLSERLALEKRAVHAELRAERASAVLAERRESLAAAEAALDAARSGAGPASMTPQAGLLLGTPSFVSGYAFPVGGGPATISVAEDHHDYPAADIAAPMGAPLYALADGVIADAWPLPNGSCGIGFVLRTGDGRDWTYCHLSHLDASVLPGTIVGAGDPVGLVGSTGNSTGPHLHLQTGPELAYPQQEDWFRAFAGTAFTWQRHGLVEDEPYPIASFAPPAPLFAVEEQPVFRVVGATPASHDVIEFNVAS